MCIIIIMIIIIITLTSRSIAKYSITWATSMIYVIIVVLIDMINCIIFNIKDVAVGKTNSYYLNSSS